MSKYKVVHYINQFFAGIGGEEKANIPPEMRDGVVGPGMAFAAALKDDMEIIATIICGDSYYAENMETAEKTILEMVKSKSPDMFIAGPAFNAGRYGTACGAICKAVKDDLGIPVLTGMYVENPGADIFKKDLFIAETKNSAADMRKAVPKMAALAMKMARGEELGSPTDEGYLERGLRKNIFREKRGAERAVDMLLAKINSQPFVTEYPMPVFDHVAPAAALKDISKAKIAIVTSGGIVPKGNPDRIESSSASKYGKYDLTGFDYLTAETHETAHGGYDPCYANSDPNRVLPIDVLRDLEREGVIGELHRYYYSTVGNGTSVGNAVKFAAEYAQELLAAGVDGVIMTST
jgi:glycine reductase